MDHTYLRYECADSFGLTVASASSKAPPSNSITYVLKTAVPPLVLTVTGSTITGFSVRSGLPLIKLGHREVLTGGVGTGRALNSDEVVCLDVQEGSTKILVASGWIDGAVRIFELSADEITQLQQQPQGVVHSLLDDETENAFVQREPLVLNGHNNQSPVRTVAFDPYNPSRLASGGSDGAVVLWDVVAEHGLFRLVGHRGGITDISFVKQQQQQQLDTMITASLDGLVKIWDLQAQCCTQTIASHRGEVWSATCRSLYRFAQDDNDDDKARWRLITGGNDGQVRVWSVEAPKRLSEEEILSSKNNEADAAAGTGAITSKESEKSTEVAQKSKVAASPDDVCHFMGLLIPPPNVSTSAERISCIHYDAHSKYVGVLHNNAKNVDVYCIRSISQSTKKRQRRLKRRQEKSKKKTNEEADDNNNNNNKKKGRKRGILDDPESSSDDDDDDEKNEALVDKALLAAMDPEKTKASDEFEYIATVRCSHKVRGFSFAPFKEKGEIVRIVCALATNALETHSLIRKRESDKNITVVLSEKLNTMDLYGHPTGIRSVALSSDDKLACTVSKNVTKIWNVASRNCVLSLSPSGGKKSKSGGGGCYGLCSAFLPGNIHVIVGTREGHLLIINIASGEVVFFEEKAHDAAIWSVDIRRPSPNESTVSLVTGSADKNVKFWVVESQDDDDDDSSDDEDDDDASPKRVRSNEPMVVHTRTLQMADDVIAVRYSSSPDSSKRMVFVSTLDCTIKVFFDDSLKLFLSLYGHKLPALALDGSDDDTILASSGADKTIKIWGLDFGDTHRTLHGHDDSITDLRFVRRTHNFFTCSKDGSVRYWDGDRFEQILLLNGHSAEVNCLAVSRTGAFVLSCGMDRQVRVWERTKDIVFLEEERERELEQVFDQVNNRDEGGTAQILNRKRSGVDDDDEEGDGMREDEPQSEAAVRKSVLSVSSGDRLMEALERADQEMKDAAAFRRSQGNDKIRTPNPILLGMEPPKYVWWVLRTIKSAELEQSLLVLPITHVERLMFYLIVLLRNGQGVELCSRVAVFIVKTHQNQIIITRSMIAPLRKLRKLLRIRVAETRDVIGFDLAALKMISRVANERKRTFIGDDLEGPKDIWAGLGLGSDVAAALEGKPTRKR